MTRVQPVLGPLRSSGVLIDLSHIVEHGMVTYRGLPAPLMCDYLSREASRERYAPGTEFQFDKIEMVGNTGTYIDSPFHRYPDGKDLSELALESVANLECLVARVPADHGRAIDSLPLSPEEVRGRAAAVRTVAPHPPASGRVPPALRPWHPPTTQKPSRGLVPGS